MIDLKRGNLLEANAEALVNTVNCVGVMGKGIALQFKQAYPENYKQYQRACKAGEVKPGRMLTIHTSLMNPKFIINFPTKRHWKGKARLSDIQIGLDALIQEVRRLGVRLIAVPPLGCGNGGLDWRDVKPMIEEAFAKVPDVRVMLFEPAGAPAPDAMPVATDRPNMTAGRALLLRLISIYAVPGYRLGRLEIQKLAYFLQAAGEELGLKFVKHRYGPYADAVNHMLERMEGHFIRGFGDRSGEAQLYAFPQALDEANRFMASVPDSAYRLGRVAELIEGFETPYGMELLATVHYVCAEDPHVAEDAEEVVRRVHAWSDRKRLRFRDQHIRKAWLRLLSKGWLILPSKRAAG